jgi:pimeloyl-ACP methyl ester carboxylesterase
MIQARGDIEPDSPPGATHWVEKVYLTPTYFHEVGKGGHFAAWEEPELFATEIRAAFKPLR